MTEVIVLGSSSGDPSTDRANASIILRAGSDMYQFDAGEGFSSSALRHNIDHSKIKTVIISHMHPDHITGLFLEIQMMYLEKRVEPLAIYAPEEAVGAIAAFMTATYLFPERMGFEIDLKPVKPDPVFRDGNITVYARANSHLVQYREMIDNGHYQNLMQSYSYVVKAGDRKMIYSGDIGSFDDYSDLLDGCDLLVTEGMHIDLEALFEKSAQNGLKRIVLTHLSAQTYSDPAPILSMAAKFGIDDIQIANDGLIVGL